MTDADTNDLALGAAVAHAVPGAQLTIRSANGGHVVAGHHPAADLSLCELRRRLVERRHAAATGSGVAAGPAGVEPVRLIDIGGVLDAVGGGVFRDVSDRLTRWVVSSACAGRTVWALRATPLDDVPEEWVTATLRPDRPLGATVVGLRVEGDITAGRIDDLALRLASSLMIADVVPAALR